MASISSLERVQRCSRWFSRLALVLAILIVLQNALFWLNPSALEQGAATLLPPNTPHELTSTAIGISFALNALVMGLLIWACWQAHQLFHAFASGQILVSATGVRLFRIGLAFALVLPAQTISSSLVMLLLTWGNPEGQRILGASVDAAHLSMALAGVLVMAVGWAMAEAARIAEDNAQII